MDFRDSTVEALAGRIRAREVSAREVTEGALARIEQVDPAVNAFVALDGERALAEAARIDERLAAGEEVGPLAGIPIGVKDLEDAEGFVTSKGSLLFEHAASATEDSVLVARLRAAGCVVLGKTNTPEMGAKGQTSNRLFGITRNPWDLERTPGGSSGGSAAALAAGMVPLATGSDGGGSIRIPAALCGLVGFKPSLGRVPAGGPKAPNWADLSTRAPMATTAGDTTWVLAHVLGPDPADLRSLPTTDEWWPDAVAAPGPAPKVAWSPTLGYSPVDPEVRSVCEAAVVRLGELGMEVTEQATVFDVDPVMAWMTLTSASNLRTVGHLRDTPEWDLLDETVRWTSEWAADHLGVVDLLEAEDACHDFNFRLVELFERVDLLLTPTVAAKAPLVETDGILDGRPDPNWVRFTYPFNLTRSPAGTVTVGFTSEGLPVGLQVVGPQHADVAVLRFLTQVERLLALDRRAGAVD